MVKSPSLKPTNSVEQARNERTAKGAVKDLGLLAFAQLVSADAVLCSLVGSIRGRPHT